MLHKLEGVSLSVLLFGVRATFLTRIRRISGPATGGTKQEYT